MFGKKSSESTDSVTTETVKEKKGVFSKMASAASSVVTTTGKVALAGAGALAVEKIGENIYEGRTGNEVNWHFSHDGSGFDIVRNDDTVQVSADNVASDRGQQAVEVLGNVPSGSENKDSQMDIG
jgi:hypothetical protein